MANGIPKDVNAPRLNPKNTDGDVENILLQFTNVFDVVLDEVLTKAEVHSLTAMAIVEDKQNVYRKVKTYLSRMDRIPSNCSLYENESLTWQETRQTKSLFFTHAL